MRFLQRCRSSFSLLIFALAIYSLQAQDDSFFDEDDLFSDDGIEEWEPVQTTESSNGTLSANLSHGILFETGSIKIGGTFDTSLTTRTTVYNGKSENTFGEYLKETTLTPQANALITLDARPTQNLRMYLKTGIAYPYSAQAVVPAQDSPPSTIEIKDFFSVKELFTDFSLLERAFFRFGLHTVTWGTGYFFSPVSDIVNTSSIDPENVTDQVQGSLNLRTQITFPGTQNCMWFYLVPDADSALSTVEARKTALAAKGEIVIAGWELGAGAFFKYESAPQAMLTASGTLFGKVSVFGEALYRYGSAAEWKRDTSFSDKKSIFALTAGASYYFKTQNILLAAQYYYDGNSDDNVYSTKGSNVAASVTFGRIFGTTDLNANLLGVFYFGRDNIDLSKQENALIAASILSGETAYLPYSALVSASVSYSPLSYLSLSLGPYLFWVDLDEKPQLDIKLTLSLGGGKF